MTTKKLTHTCDAEVTIKFLVQDICQSGDLDDLNSLWQAVYEKLQDEGICTYVCDDDYEVLEVREI